MAVVGTKLKVLLLIDYLYSNIVVWRIVEPFKPASHSNEAA